jgi:SAM-dependent methyltransferase
MNTVGSLHSALVFPRRVQRLVAALARLLPTNASVLDVGCGDGTLDRLLLKCRPDLRLEGIDVLVRQETKIPVTAFDGQHIPFPDRNFDVVVFVDVLHHTDDPAVLMREAGRVAGQFVVIKDHQRDRFFAGPTLRLMDYVGNAHHGVRLPYNYLKRTEWSRHWNDLGLEVVDSIPDLKLYPWPFDYIFGGSLHFMARLQFQRPQQLVERQGDLAEQRAAAERRPLRPPQKPASGV